jgi:carbon-monoxide dehydrogenase small subunit
MAVLRSRNDADPAGSRVQVVVNGEALDLRVDPGRLLISVLRDDLGLTGTKISCGIGVCGACAVLVDGRVASSCLLLAGQIDGREVTTIEGLASTTGLDRVQMAFVEKGGFQCGICTPGQVMAARALLDDNPAPSLDQVKDWMTGNLCRCTGYYKIVEAVLAAAEQPAIHSAPNGPAHHGASTA